MKNTYLFLIGISLILFSCKKGCTDPAAINYDSDYDYVDLSKCEYEDETGDGDSIEVNFEYIPGAQDRRSITFYNGCQVQYYTNISLGTEYSGVVGANGSAHYEISENGTAQVEIYLVDDPIGSCGERYSNSFAIELGDSIVISF